MSGWSEHIEWAAGDRAVKLSQARAALAADEWPGALAAFEEYLAAADDLESCLYLGFGPGTADYSRARDAAATARACLGVRVDPGSWLALENYFDACLHWRLSVSHAFQAVEAGTSR